MCAEYEIRTRKKSIDDALDRTLINRTGLEEWAARIKLSLKSPVIIERAGQLELIESTFPVRPFPNARLSSAENSDDVELVRRIYERPTWAPGFRKERCVVVMSAFFEPAYWGPEKGGVMRFEPPQGELFFVAAIRIRAQTPKTENAHALLTHSASEQMLSYHHRMLVLLSPGDVHEWVRGGEVEPREKFDFLLHSRIVDELKVSRERTMAKGWEKRVDEHEEALRDEKALLAQLAREGVEG